MSKPRIIGAPKPMQPVKQRPVMRPFGKRRGKKRDGKAD